MALDERDEAQAEANYYGYQIAKAQILPATVRSYPAIADGRIYIRTISALYCFGAK